MPIENAPALKVFWRTVGEEAACARGVCQVCPWGHELCLANWCLHCTVRQGLARREARQTDPPGTVGNSTRRPWEASPAHDISSVKDNLLLPSNPKKQGHWPGIRDSCGLRPCVAWAMGSTNMSGKPNSVKQLPPCAALLQQVERVAPCWLQYRRRRLCMEAAGLQEKQGR